jgi:hypothetical protein
MMNSSEESNFFLKRQQVRKAVVCTIKDNRFRSLIAESSLKYLNEEKEYCFIAKYPHGLIMLEGWKDSFVKTLKENGFDGKTVIVEQTEEEAKTATLLQQQ